MLLIFITLTGHIKVLGGLDVARGPDFALDPLHGPHRVHEPPVKNPYFRLSN